MPDVGVLNLQIQENSESAIRGLDNLVGALERVKNAVSGGLKLSPIATGLKRIGQVVDENIHGSTIVKIGQLADELSKLKGVGNVNIRISGSETVEAVRDAAKETKEALGGINTGFDDIAPRAGQVMETAEAVKELHDSIVSVANEKIDYSKLDLNKFLATPLEALTERYRQTGGAASDFSARVSAAIPALQEYRDTVLGLESKKDIAGFSKKTGEELVASMKAASESAKKVTEETAKGMTVAAEEVQQAVGTTVASTEEIVERTVSAEEEYAKQFEAICESMKEKAAEADAIRKGQEEKFYAPAFSMEKTNDMADSLTKLDLLQAQLKEAEAKYNELVNSLGAQDVKSIKAGLAVSDLRDKIWAYKEALQEANNEANAASGTTENLQNQFDNETSSITEATAASNEHKESLKKMADAADDAGSRISSAGFSFKEFKKSIRTMFPLLDRLRRKLGSQIITRSIRYAIRAVTSGIKEGVENVYYYSKAINSSFAPSLDSAASSLQTMKNSLGAAAAPLIQSLIPLLQTLVNWFIEAVNWVNQFISLLRGQTTWTKAVPATTTAFEKQEKAARKAGNAIKDLLADWDELNIIQSETSGAGTGLGSGTVENYLNMFEEVGEFSSEVKRLVDFIKNNLEQIENIALGIGAAILGWKLSHAFSGALGTLGNLILGGALIDIGLNLSYASGFQAGLEGEWSAETLLGAVAGGIASAIGGSVIGYALAGPGGAVVGAIIGATLALAATIVAYKKGSATAAAKAAFADTGDGGINPQDYIDALQTELDSRTKGAKLILDAYVEVPGLKQSLQDAVTEIVSFNTIIFGGDGELTEEDATAFEENWTKVLNTLNSMSKATYDTLLGGVISALKSDNEELRKQAEDARVSLIMARDQVSEARAKWTKDTEDLKDKIKSGEYSEEDLEEYKRRLAYAAKMSGAEISYVDGVQSMLDRYDVINFGDKDTALDNAKEFITNVGESVHDALDSIEEAKKTIESAKDDAIREVEELYTGGYLTDDEYKGQVAAIEAAYEVDLKFLTDSESEVKSKLQDAYDIVFKQLGEAADKLTGDNRKIYLRDIVGPMMEYAEQQGYKYSKEFQDKYGEEISKNQARSQMLEEYKSGEDVPWYVKLMDKTIFSGNENGLFGVMEDLSDIFGFDMAYENARGQRVEDIQRYEEEFAQGLKDEIEQTKQAIKTELENGASLDELYSKYQEDLYGENMHDYIAETFNELNQDEIRSVADQIKDLVQNHDMTFGEARNSVEASADIIEKAFDLAYQELENLSGANEFLLHSVQNQMDTYGLSLDKALEMFSDPVYGYTAGELDKVREVLGGVGEATKAAEEAKEGLESAIEGMGEMDVGEAWFDWSNKIHINLPDDISSGARHYVDMIANAINSGKGLEEIQAANDQALEMFGVDAFIEALPYIQELTEKWKTMNGTLDNLNTEGIQDETNSAAASYEDMARRIRAAFQSLDGIGFSVSMDGTTGNLTVTLPQIPMAATGAFVRSGDLVMANENGNFEMMGRMGNQPVIANNQQIVEGISNGVSNANGDVVSELRGLSGLMRQMLNGGLVAKVMPSSTMGRNNNRSAEAYDRVTG